MSSSKGSFLVVIGMWLVSFLVSVALSLGVIYALVHFARKFW